LVASTPHLNGVGFPATAAAGARAYGVLVVPGAKELDTARKPAVRKRLDKVEVRRIAVNIAKLPDLLGAARNNDEK
jgi:hypothetical protein